MEKKYELRELKADDLFMMLKIINKIGVKEVKNCFAMSEMKEQLQTIANADGDNNNEYVSAVGLNVMVSVVSLLVERLPDCKDELYAFLSSLSGMKTKEIADMPMADFYEMVMEVVKHHNFKDFFQRLVGSFK